MGEIMEFKKLDLKLSLDDLKPDELQKMADSDPNAFLKFMEGVKKKVMESFGVPAGIIAFPSDLSAPSIYASTAKSSGWASDLTTNDLGYVNVPNPPTYGKSPTAAVYEGMAAMRHYMTTRPCCHCDDRDFWQRGLIVTLVGRVCRTCADVCLSRGITVRHITNRRFSVMRRVQAGD